jgi:hypothetical protein
MRRAQHATAVDANSARDQVDARPTRLAFSPHLRGDEEAKLAHREWLRSVVGWRVAAAGGPAGRRRDPPGRTRTPFGARNATDLGEKRRRTRSVRKCAERAQRVLGIHGEHRAECVGIDADALELGEKFLEALFVSHPVPLDLFVPYR